MFGRLRRYLKRQPVAFVALFFALGGGALAANGYIRSTETIPAGDLAGTTYGDPLIASGAVTNGKLANPSLSINPGIGLSGGGSVTLGGSTTLGVADGGIGTTQLADDAVTTSKFASGAQAPDSAKLGGIGPDGFVQGTGSVVHGYASPSPDGSLVVVMSVPNILQIRADCHSDGSYDVLFFTDVSFGGSVWWSHRGAVGYSTASGPFASAQTFDDVITAHAADGTHTATITVAAHPATATPRCIFSGQAISQ
jgi:hypothetical protein